MKRILAGLLTVAILAWPYPPALGQRAGTVGQDGEWNVRHVTAVVHMTTGSSPQFTMFRVNCGSGAATAVAVATGRRDLRLKNVGNLNIYVGGGHVTVTTSNAWTLHAASVVAATSVLDLQNFQGTVQCIADDVGQTLEVIQILR